METDIYKVFSEGTSNGAASALAAHPFSCRSAHARPYVCSAVRASYRAALLEYDENPPSFPYQSLFTTTSFFGCIAQLVEHWAFNLMVAGSSPAIPKPTLHSTMKKDA